MLLLLEQSTLFEILNKHCYYENIIKIVSLSLIFDSHTVILRTTKTVGARVPRPRTSTQTAFSADQHKVVDEQQREMIVAKNAQESIKFGLLNIRSLSKEKVFTLRKCISDNRLGFIFLTETWFKSYIPINLFRSCPEGFTARWVNRPNNQKGGGIAVIYHEKYLISYPAHEYEFFSSFEYFALIKQPENLLIVTVYRPPRGSKLDFYSQFGEMLSIICLKHDKIIIVGDFNFHVHKDPCESFLKLFNDYKFVQHVKDPTHKQGNTLDLVFTRGIDVRITSIDPFDFSDHHCIRFTTGFEDNIAGSFKDLMLRRRPWILAGAGIALCVLYVCFPVVGGASGIQLLQTPPFSYATRHTCGSS